MSASRYVQLMEGWNDFWTWANENQLAATVVGGLIVAALIGLFSILPKIGPHVRSGVGLAAIMIGVAARWLWSWHPVSARRLRKDLDAQFDTSAVESAALVASLTENVEALSTRVAMQEQAANASVAAVTKIRENADAYAKDRSKASIDTHASAMSPRLPLPAPRWRIDRESDDPTGETYNIVNSIERSVAREVRVNDSHDDYGEPNGVATILDGGHFEDLSGRSSGTFRARLGSRTRQGGGTLSVTWYDENNAQQHEYVRVDGFEAPEASAGSWGPVPGSPRWSNDDHSPF